MMLIMLVLQVVVNLTVVFRSELERQTNLKYNPPAPPPSLALLENIFSSKYLGAVLV